MSQALLGLLGAIVGAAAAFGGTYFMAMRSERRRQRASARLLEDDLRRVERDLDWLGGKLAEPEMTHIGYVQLLIRTSEGWITDVWEEQRPLLAETASISDWYRVSRAYEWISETRRVDEEIRSKEGLVPGSDFFDVGRDRIQAANEALARLAAR